MSQKPSNPLEGLRAMLAQALQAYELARATYRRDREIAQAEQARVDELLAAIQEVEQQARDLLEKAGLAHIAGAPLQLGGTVASVRRSDEAVAAAFVQVQTASVDLRTAVCRLAEAQLKAGLWEDTRCSLQPLLADKNAPLYANAHDLLCETYYRPALAALESGEWPAARQGFEAVLGIDSGYHDTAAQLREAYLRPAGLALEAGRWEEARQHAEAWLSKQKDDNGAQSLLRESYLRPAQQALDAEQWEAVRQYIEPWLGKHKDDGGARTLLCESYYRPGQQALTAGQWEAARTQFQAVLAQQAGYRDAAELLRTAYVHPAQQALEAGQWDAVRRHIQPWLDKHEKDAEARVVLCESYYQPALALLESGDWQAARQGFEAVLRVDSGYRDTPAQLREAYLRPASQSLNAERWKDACTHAGDWLQKHRDDTDIRDLLHQGLRRWLDFAQIPAGDFLYGDNKQKIHLAEFQILRTPVTNAQYQAFVDATGCRALDHWSGNRPPQGKEEHPVVNVSWEDARAFCRWVGVQLPSERQWEKAARGADGRTYPWGNEPPDNQRCNFDNQVGDTTAVGSYPKGASPYGLLDMAGNVWEWCEDAHESGGRVLRGGAFSYSGDLVRCVARYGGNPNNRHNHGGFRVVAPSS